MSLNRLLAIAIVTLSSSACRANDVANNAARNGGATLKLVALRPIRLEEDSIHFVGHPASLIVDPDEGSIFVGDIFGKRILQFDEHGGFAREYAGAAVGVNRVRALYDMLVSPKDVIAVDEKHHELSFYDRASGLLRRRQEFVQAQPELVLGPEGTIYTGGFDEKTRTLVSRWVPSSNERRPLVAFNGEIERSPRLGREWMVRIAPWVDTVAVSFGPSDSVYIQTAEGRNLWTLGVPAVRRRGVPHRFQVDTTIGGNEVLNGVSYVSMIRALSGGRLLLLHIDNTNTSSAQSTQMWASVVSGDRHWACVDAAVPVSSLSHPFAATRGDTLFVLSQSIRGGNPESEIKPFVIDDSRCSWLPTHLHS